MKHIKRFVASFLSVAAAFSLVCCSYSNVNNNGETSMESANNTEEMNSYQPIYQNDGSVETAEKWLRSRIENNDLFSFRYNGKEFDDFIFAWNKKVDEHTDDDGNKLFVVTYDSPDNITFSAEIKLDILFASVEWICYFKNNSDSESAVISDILPLDYSVEVKDAVLTTTKGSKAQQDDFEPVSVNLNDGKYSMSSEGGRSSSGAFPYFDLSNGIYGVLGAIGWTGDWKAEFENDGGSVIVTAGMKETRISLFSGEEMRTPSSVLMFFNGDQDAGHNKFRQLILQSYTPSDETGTPITSLPYCINVWGGSGEKSILETIELCERLRLEYDTLWIDAGWYCSTATSGSGDLSWYNQLGNWDVSESIYPDGFRNISARLSELGKNLLLWFEPERAMQETQIVAEHPEYFLPKKSSFYLYNFADNEATDYMINKVSSILKENNIKWYRQDFNCSPADTWRTNDLAEGENRIGITEIKYITNLYRYLDTIRQLNPGLMIDNCASGGRRLDIEMMKRSVPLWRTDYNITKGSVTDGVRMSNYGLSWWLPLSAGGCSSEGRITDYHWRSMIASGLDLGAASVRSSLYLPGIEQYQLCKKYINGDYYILCQGSQEKLKSEYAVYEYYRPDEEDGCLIVFRPEECSVSKKTVKLKGLKSDTVYVLNITETGETVEATGEELMTVGLTLKLHKSNTSLLILIDKKA